MTSKIYFPMSFLFKNYSLFEVVHLCIRCNKTKFFLWNTNNTDKNGVNKQNTHTKHLEKNKTRKGGWGSNYEPSCFWIFVFDNAKEASNDATTFLNLRFITKQKPVVFWENITCWRALSQEGFIECTRLFLKNSTKQNLKKVTAILKILYSF